MYITVLNCFSSGRHVHRGADQELRRQGSRRRQGRTHRRRALRSAGRRAQAVPGTNFTKLHFGRKLFG
jgi:hypothetical protein